MAGNSEHNREGWAWNKTGDDEVNKVSAASTSLFQDPVSQPPSAELGGRRTSPRDRVNPFLSRQFSDGGDTQPVTPSTQPVTPSTLHATLPTSAKVLAPSTQNHMLSSGTELPAPSTQPSMLSAVTEALAPSTLPLTLPPSGLPDDPASEGRPEAQESGETPLKSALAPGTALPPNGLPDDPASERRPEVKESGETPLTPTLDGPTATPGGQTSPSNLPTRATDSAASSGFPAESADHDHQSVTSDFIGITGPTSPDADLSRALDPYISPSSPAHERYAALPSSPARDSHGLETPPSSARPPYGLETPPSPARSQYGLETPPSPARSQYGLETPPSPARAPYGLAATSSAPADPYGAGAWPAGPCSSGDEDWERRPPAERWAPLGANDADDEGDDRDFGLAADSRRSSLSSADLSRLRKLEEEQEHLNNSLMALTTHFAQVQFRLRQIVEAPGEEKEQLLQDLETFAFRGIPDVRQYKLAEAEEEELTNEWKHQEMVETQRIKQRDLMLQLKTQLEDLEHYAYETGEAGLPSSVVLEKQRVIIDELKGKLNIDIDNLDRMTSEDLKSLVDCAVGQLINPLKMKEQLVNQLKTQVQDLERFISFLQGETEEGGCDGSCRRGGDGGGAASTSGDESGAAGDTAGPRPRLRRRSYRQRSGKHQEVHDETSSIMKRALTLLQLVTLTQFGCGGHSHHFSSNELKKTPRGNHWGDLRARLELAVSAVSELAKESLRDQQVSDRGTDDSDAAGPPSAGGDRLTLAVRRELAVTLRDLMQHGLLQMSRSRSVVPFAGCLPSRSAAPRLLHAWDLVLVYYRLKRGVQFNATPQRRLSQSFGLAMVGGTAITSKHTLLSTIGNIISSHTPLKRSADAHFKAFVCAGLNARKLNSWLRLILTTQAITEEYYQPWSYVVSTGFDDALQCVARLEKLRFQLPEDLAVRQLRNIRDAF